MTKDDLYDKLVTERIACRRCQASGLTNPSIVSSGRFDSPEIGPWSRWQGGLGATLMIVGQDWGTVEYFSEHAGLDGPETSNPTNEALRALVRELGIEIGPPGDLRRAGVVFLTNAVLCLKGGSLQAPVRTEWFVNCGDFLRRQVEIVAPRLLVCLGERAYRSLAAAFGFRPGPFRAAVERADGVELPTGTRAFARYHCGRRIQNTHRPFPVQRQDWCRLVRFL